MERTKRKRLEAAGWQFGSAADFLGLTEEESAYIELRLRLSDALKARRRASGLSQKACATAIESSQSRIAKMEAADPSVSLDLLIRSLIALGVSLPELGRITINAAPVNPKPKRTRAQPTRKATKKR